MNSLDVLVKLLTTPGIFWPLLMTNSAMFCAGGYAALSLKFVWMHRATVTEETFDKHVAQFKVLEATVKLNERAAQDAIQEVREDLSGDIEKLRDDVVSRMDKTRLEIKGDIREMFEILDKKSDSIHKSLHDFKNAIQHKYLSE